MARPPTSEIGAPAEIGINIPGVGTLASWTDFQLDELENVPELQFPNSVLTYNAMRNDAQIEGLYLGATMPIRRYKWAIDPNGADEAKTEKLAKDMNLPINGRDPEPLGRYKKRFVFDHHLKDALLGILYGFYYFEQVGNIGDDGMWHLRKLAPRPPATIAGVRVASDGGLLTIKQNVMGQRLTSGIPQVEIPVDRSVAYVWDQEGANWYGRSMLRALYRNWLIKDRLLRVDAIKHERNGVGVPVGFGPPGYTPDELARLGKLASSFKAGESSGSALPYGSDLKLLGVQGSLPDTIASIKFHNEEMARRFLMMFMVLGQSSSGSRALGGEFIDYFLLAQEGIANWARDVFNEHVIEDWWDWNYGTSDEYVPRLVYRRNDDPRFATADLALMIQNNVVQVDDDLEKAVRDAMDLPVKGTPRALPATTDPNNPSPPDQPPNLPGQGTPQPTSQAKRQERPVRATSTSPDVPLPDRPLRRQAMQFEADAKTNFAQLDDAWQAALDQMFETWKSNITNAQIEDLRAQIAKTSSAKKLANVEPAALGEDMLAQGMIALWEEGVRQAIQEAADQGVTIPQPELDVSLASINARAQATASLAARAIGSMAATKATQLTGGKLSKAEVADSTAEYLGTLQHAMLRDRLAGAMSQALNAGRRAVFAAGPAADFYASEILDTNTCVPCIGIDGTTWTNLADAEAAYPTGGFSDCSGGDRCRGTIVAVYRGEEEN